MALYTTPQEHAANPPETWRVVRRGDRLWSLTDAQGATFQTFPTRREALSHREEGFYVDLYVKEGRWFAGERVAGWKRYEP